MTDQGPVEGELEKRGNAIAFGVIALVLAAVPYLVPYMVDFDGHWSVIGLRAVDFGDLHPDREEVLAFDRAREWVLIPYAVGAVLLALSTVLRMLRIPDPRGLPLTSLITAPLAIGVTQVFGLYFAVAKLTPGFLALVLYPIVGIAAGQVALRVASRDELARIERAVIAGDQAVAEERYRTLAARRAVRTRVVRVALSLFVVGGAIALAIEAVSKSIAVYRLVEFVGHDDEVVATPFSVGIEQYGLTGSVALRLVLFSLKVIAVGVVFHRFGRGIAAERRAMHAWRVRSSLRLLGADEAKTLRGLLAELGERMLGDREPFREIYLDRTARSAAPSVIYEGPPNTHVLMISPQLITLAVAAPATARAMLAHELAHVRQRDARLWPLAMMISVVSRRVVVPFTVIFVVVAAGFAIEEHDVAMLGLLGVNIAIMVGVLSAVTGVRTTRSHSEALADLAAIVYVGAKPLGDALRKLAGLDTPWHEPVEVRRARATRCEIKSP